MMKKNWCSFLMKIGLIFGMALLGGCQKLTVLNSHGQVGAEEAFLIKLSLGLMLIVVLPVFVMVIWFSIRYRASNKKATYKPYWAHSSAIEWVVWLVPIAIVCVLGYLTWVKTHELDPYKPLQSKNKTVRVEVISTDWNWLFIYPDEHVASVNELVFPENTPVSFHLTSASVMTSFFIPQLGSQMYAMAGMRTQLNLMADTVGVYDGKNIEYSGNGYATMHFKALSMSPGDFEAWLKRASQSDKVLNEAAFEQLRKPQINYPVTLFSNVTPGLFNHILHEFMGWMGGSGSKEMIMDQEHSLMNHDDHHPNHSMEMPTPMNDKNNKEEK